MKLILNIADAFETKRGIVIAGINPFFDEMSLEQIKEACKGVKILKSDTNEIIINIIDVQTTESMWGKKNIFCLISDSYELKKIPKAGEIYSQ